MSSFWLKSVLTTILIVSAAMLCWTQDKEQPIVSSGYESYVRKLLVRTESNCMVPAVGWAKKREQIMQGLRRTLGADLPRQWPVLNARVESNLQRNECKIEQVSAEFWPGVRYAMQVYIPPGNGPFPGVVMISTGRHGPREALYQQLGIGFARSGILVVGVLALGKGVQNEAYQYNGLALLVGTSIAQEQFHTGQRALDYLLSRQDVDSKRVGITGDSDGGWVSLYVATFDSRIAAAAPASTNYTFCGWLLPERWKTNDHAEGNAPEVLTYGANIPTLTACNAPKWFHFLNSEQEWERLQYIPIIDAAAKAAYQFAGVSEHYSSHVAPCPHGLWPVMQIEDIGWFSEIFFGRRPPEGTLTLRKVPGKRFEELLITEKGKEAELVETIPPDQENWKKMQVGNLEDDGGKPAFLQIIETRRQDARASRATLTRDRVRLSGELERCLGINSLNMDPKGEAKDNMVVLETEPGLRVSGEWIKAAADKSKPISLVLGTAKDREGDLDLPASARFDLALREEATLGPTTWALVMLNRPPIGMWAWDAMCAAHWLKQQGFYRVELVGVGDTGAVVALLAGVLSKDVNTVRLKRCSIKSLDEDVIGKQLPRTPYWAHRLLWVADLPEIIGYLKSQGKEVTP